MKRIKILGAGCAKCRKLAENVEAAAARIGLECEIEKVTGIDEIMQHGVMMTPALVVDDEVVVSGKVPKVARLEALLGGEVIE